MKEHLRVFLGAALLLLLLDGCATPGIKVDRAQEEAASVEAEIKALSQSFWNRILQRANTYHGERTKAIAEVKPLLDVDDEKAGRSLDRYSEMAGRIRFIVNFIKLLPGVTAGQWMAAELPRLANEKADAERDVASDKAQIAAWKAANTAIDIESPRVQKMLDRVIELGELRGEWLEAVLVAQDLDANTTGIRDIYRRAEERQQAAIAEERQAELARQQGLLLFLGGMQQINNNLQQQQHYNQQQIYQQQILHELMKPTTCHSYGATTTCY